MKKKTNEEVPLVGRVCKYISHLFVYSFTWQCSWRWQRCCCCFSTDSNPKFWEIPLRTFVCIWLVRGTHFVASNCQSAACAFWVRQLGRCAAFDWFSIGSHKMCAHAVTSSVNLFPRFLRRGNFCANIPNRPNICWDASQASRLLDGPTSISISIHHTLCAAIGISLRIPIWKNGTKRNFKFYVDFWWPTKRWANKPSTLSPCTLRFVALSGAVHLVC